MSIQIGLVSRDKLNNEYEKIKEVVAQGYNLFVSTGSSDEAIREFKEQYCCVVHIEFLGVWWVPDIFQFNFDHADRVDQQGHSLEFRILEEPNTAVCGRQHVNCVQTGAIP